MVAASLIAETSSGERSQGVVAGSSSAARSDLGKPSPSKPRSASAHLALRSIQVREGAYSLRVRHPVLVRNEPGVQANHRVHEERGVDSI